MSIRKGDKIIASSGGGGGTNVLVDNNTIVKNDSDVITTVGVQTKDGGIKYDWVGTLSEYNAGVKAGTIQDDWFCYITDDEEVAMHRYMGELVSSIMPIMDASGETPKSLHLLDGELISSSGMYKSFAEYLDKAIELFPSLDGTESEWQDFVAEFGEVPFFVVDKTNFTIRLPLIKNPIQGVTDLSILGNLLEVGCEKSSVLTSPIVQPAGCYYIVLSPNSASIDGLDDYVADIKEEILGKVEEIPRIIETYRDGYSWYRVYSDGWCEQGGLATTTISGDITITLLKPYKDLNYTISYTAQSENNEYAKVGTSDITVSGFTAYWNGDSTTSRGIYWHTMGYMA